MRAVAFSAHGTPDVLEPIELPIPEPGPGEVRVRVRAAGVQPFDTALRQGLSFGFPVTFPQVLGNEFAGTVDAVGEGVTEFAPGDGVLGWQLLSCYAEYTVAPVAQVVAKPEGMPWEVAGVLSASGQTASTALEELKVARGETVLVHAAAGGVGTFAVQIARDLGATVIGTASPGNHDHLRSLGAVPVSYGEGLVERVREVAPQGVDAALDAAGAEALRASIQVVGDRARIGTLVAFDLVEETGVRAIRSQRSRERLEELVALHERGGLQVPLAGVFDLSDAAGAHRLSETGHLRGKVVITVKPTA
ncbi:NADP-dependent oxidoreductase [Nocardiopsis halotolerans]|uniref:NADP-dependent oxidoreductase n=1 Tax=Nocardiopsis halotolerans TaxID=124252 RepID=UPI000347BE1A|nr:NADP-dependent oxidoreductase [Nocardiopsis halotolerans]